MSARFFNFHLLEIFALAKILQVFEETRVGSKAVFIHGDVVIVIRTKLFEGVRVLEKMASIGVRNDAED